MSGSNGTILGDSLKGLAISILKVIGWCVIVIFRAGAWVLNGIADLISKLVGSGH